MKPKEWKYLEPEINAKFQFRENTSKKEGKLIVLDTCTIKYASNNHRENNGSGISLGSVNKDFFPETIRTLSTLWELTPNEEEFIHRAQLIFRKKGKYVIVKCRAEHEELVKKYIEDLNEEF